MTRVRFLNDLYHHLYGLTPDQAELHLTYYAEMLADRIEEGMSEEEAVASMEDVETIARRIMEEEGLPYTPPEQRPLSPPSCPDASRLGGGGFTRAYKVPKRWDWRKIARVALWAAAILTVIVMIPTYIVERQWWRGGSATSIETMPDMVVDSTTALVEDTPYLTEGWGYAGLPYESGYAFAGGENYFDVGGVQSIHIEWASGMVGVLTYGGKDVLVQEYSEYELSERTRMMLAQDDGLLTITYRDGVGLGNVKGSKYLNVFIPEGLMGEINIQTSSAEVFLGQLELDTLRVNTASGDITCDECYVQTAELTTVSGDLSLNHLCASQTAVSSESGDVLGDLQCTDFSAHSVSGDMNLTFYDRVEKLDLDTVSGDIWASVEDASIRSINAESTSGNISLSLPWDISYTLEFSSVSGDVDLPGFEGTRPSSRNGRYVQGDGGCQISVNTISGNFMIY